MRLSYTALEKDDDRKIYGILRGELKLSAAIIRRLKNAKAIFLNGEPAYATVRVKPGDNVEAEILSAEREPDLVPEDGEIKILLETPQFIAVDKPAGQIVHPSCARPTGSLANFVAGYFKRSGQDCACHVVNRLDRDTSGVVIFAKSAHWKTILCDELKSEDAVKEYEAIVFGRMPECAGVIDLPIRRAEPQMMRRIVSDDGKRAITEYEVIETGEKTQRVRYRLRTGRTHQIRVHSSFLGAPLVGDRLYGTPESIAFSEEKGINEHILRCWRMEFSFLGEKIKINACKMREAVLY